MVLSSASAWAWLCVCCFAGTALASPIDQASCASVQNFILGNNLNVGEKTVKSEADCCAACQENSRCKAWTFHGNGECWLHSAATPITHMAGVVSGVPSGPLPPLPPPPPPIGVGGGYACNTTNTSSLPFCDTSKSIDERLDDLVPRLQLDEIGQQLTARESFAVPRLGLPPYYWGTNAIHGMQNVKCLANGLCPTSFPAPCALSATFNMSLVKDMGGVIGKELRAYYNARVHDSLDTWSPTININRDPRWGRNVESPGEDPLVAGLFGSAYTEGLQAFGQEKVAQAIVTLKHWLAYSIESYNGVTRTNVDVKVSAYDLANTYMVAWKRTVQQGKALGIMCSYNMVNGRPTCGNPALNATLRQDWGYQGYITSDSDACGCIWNSHYFEPNATLAVRDCLEGGTDIDSGGTYSGFLAQSVTLGETSQKSVDLALRNSYKMRMLTGLFDPHVDNPYRHISTDVVGQQSHQDMSLNSARKAMVLLKNDKGILPLKTGSKIAVVGQSIADPSFYTGNYNGPLCPTGGAKTCWKGIVDEVAALNSASGGTTTNTTSLDAANVGKAIAGADTVICVVDNARDGGGEGHDRYSIGLSADQIALVQQVIQSGKPFVLVMINGGMISLDWLKESSPAILEAFMPGVHGAQAVAETLFGLNNPGGKLPVTMFNSSYINETDFLSMDMNNGVGRSYRYFRGTPLFPFGFGLSYTSFSIKWSSSPPQAAVQLVGADASQTYKVTVTNTGSVAGDEVVFLFVHPDQTPGAYPTLPSDTPKEIKRLAAFERVHLAAGSSTTISFTVPATDLALVDVNGHRSLHPGKFTMEVTRGHGASLKHVVEVDTENGGPLRLETFRKWW